ncbi:hypothetical protein SLEP1_g10816 [Rubroshorea leprosula]|uniref:Uncharacterized protein n=1 Tax=Rubroshorea leprosula TaxID=152421 RepID=A0AAV5IF16_9ROSI|nr:hypothetical protein SLEP1_g10816 [Rubroshorea leprosula]
MKKKKKKKPSIIAQPLTPKGKGKKEDINCSFFLAHVKSPVSIDKYKYVQCSALPLQDRSRQTLIGVSSASSFGFGKRESGFGFGKRESGFGFGKRESGGGREGGRRPRMEFSLTGNALKTPVWSVTCPPREGHELVILDQVNFRRLLHLLIP